MEYVIFAFFCIILILSFIISNLLKKVERYEDRISFYEDTINNQQEYVKRVYSIVSNSRDLIKQVDERGIFEADDDIGMFFRYLKEIQDTLGTFVIKEINGKSQE